MQDFFIFSLCICVFFTTFASEMRRFSLHSIVILLALIGFCDCAHMSDPNSDLLYKLDERIQNRADDYAPRGHQADSLHSLFHDSLSHTDRFELYGRMLETYRAYILDSQQYYAELRVGMAQTPFEKQVSLLNYAEVMMRRDSIEQMHMYIDSALQQPLNPALTPYFYQTLYPVVENAYHKQIRRRQYWMLGVIASALTILSLVVAFLLYVNRKRRQLAVLNRELAHSNEDLRRSNRIKGVYVKRFLKITSIRDFDDAFLELFPDFVPQVQCLLVPEAELRIKPNERLNTDLRVLALIYLGITDSKQIADILHYSLSTIYNSRTRMRNLSKGDRENFEQLIMEL